MKYLLRVLGISHADIARQAGISRQAVNQGSPKGLEAAQTLIDLARFNTGQISELQAAHAEIEAFLKTTFD